MKIMIGIELFLFYTVWTFRIIAVKLAKMGETSVRVEVINIILLTVLSILVINTVVMIISFVINLGGQNEER